MKRLAQVANLVTNMFHDLRLPSACFRPLTAVAIDIRAMWPGDEEEVRRIEAASFPLADQWTVEDFYQVFDPAAPTNGHVALAAGRIVGFCVTRIANIGTLVLENLTVLPELRRLRVASRLLGNIEDRKMVRPPQRFRTVVRESNLAAQLFFRFAGWRATGMLTRPWKGIAEDGIKFRKWIG